MLHCLGQVQSSLSGALSFKTCSICTALTIDFSPPEESWSLKPPNEEQLLLCPHHVGAGEHGDTMFRFLPGLLDDVVRCVAPGQRHTMFYLVTRGCKGLPGRAGLLV